LLLLPETPEREPPVPLPVVDGIRRATGRVSAKDADDRQKPQRSSVRIDPNVTEIVRIKSLGLAGDPRS